METSSLTRNQFTTKSVASQTADNSLQTLKPLRRTTVNRIFAAVYTSAILALLYRHVQILLVNSITTTTSSVSFSVTLCLLVSDLVLAFFWATSQAFRMRPIRRKQFPENLRRLVKEEDYPGLDVFICTADPFREPPINVVNTALSLMAYDYPTDKISVYVSDDGGSALTLFAFMEAAKFASYWLPFCRENNLMERSPKEYFASNYNSCSPTKIEKIKTMYENMKVKVENAVERGEISEEYITNDEERKAFSKWTDGFTSIDHPAVIQVILDKSKDKDITGNLMPSLIYVSRQKSKTSPHHFKAGALNVLLRVSAVMSNAPIILTQDCDMHSNDPKTPLRVICYMLDPAVRSEVAYIQFPQRFYGLSKNDIYALEYKRVFQITTLGLDGLKGPNYVGTGCFFNRRALFGSPLTLLPPEIPELSPDRVADKPIKSQAILALAHNVASCSYENNTQWGCKIGFRYGSLVEDFYTGYQLHCEGWRSLFCHPERAAFLGGMPVTLFDLLVQCKRWCVGLFDVGFCKYNPLVFGSKSMGILMGFSYSYYGFYPLCSIAICIYAFLPQLALLNKVSIFPKVSEPWFFLYIFLFLGAYGQELLDFVLAGGTVRAWWNCQRMWMIRGVSADLFASVEYLLKTLGIYTHGFSLTNKVYDDEESKRYGQELFEFGVTSPLFVPMTMAAIINLCSFISGLTELLVGNGSNKQGLCLQMLLTGFIVVNCLPIYGAIALRSDKGKMPNKTTIIAAFLAGALYIIASLFLK